MEDTIKQFLALPATIRLAVSSPQAIERLEQIEAHYKVRLADIVIRVVTKNLQLSTLQNEFERQFSLDGQRAKELYDDLMRDIFSQVAGHLGISQSIKSQPAVASSAVHEMSLGEIHTDPDVIAHAQKLKFEPPATYDAAAFAAQLVKDLSLSMPDSNTGKRFSIIVESRLVDARTREETIERLQRAPKIGGMGLDQATSERIVAAVEKERDRIHAAHLHIIAKDVLPDEKKIAQAVKSPVRHPQMPHVTIDAPMAPPLNNTVKAIPAVTPSPTPPVLESTKTPPLPPGVVMRPKVTASSIPAFMKPPKPAMPQVPLPQPIMPAAPRPEVPHFMPKVFRQDSAKASRPQMQDITTQKKLVGPVEELGQMTIQDFRKLGNSPSESANRLKEMVGILNQESLAQRSAGLKAWRTSPMMREYLEIGNKSMESSQGIEQVIAGLRAKNSLSMTQDEFDIIASLNRSLRY